jgi:mono/diheme cytochrome c family protein
MKKVIAIVGSSLTLLFSSTTFAAGNPEAGKALHNDANCLQCHAAQPYNPKKTNTFEKLVKAVEFCNVNLNTGWFEDEVLDVAAYLNKEYYKLK